MKIYGFRGSAEKFLSSCGGILGGKSCSLIEKEEEHTVTRYVRHHNRVRKSITVGFWAYFSYQLVDDDLCRQANVVVCVQAKYSQVHRFLENQLEPSKS